MMIHVGCLLAVGRGLQPQNGLAQVLLAARDTVFGRLYRSVMTRTFAASTPRCHWRENVAAMNPGGLRAISDLSCDARFRLAISAIPPAGRSVNSCRPSPYLQQTHVGGLMVTSSWLT
jgi:hypothetical protein